MRSLVRNRIVVLGACLALGMACNRQPGTPASDAAKSDTSQKLPFDRQPGELGISPSRSLLPPSRRLPEGTPLTISLQRDISSASAHTDDSFTATLDVPIVIDGQTLVPRGAPVTGRVLESKPSAGPRDPGYLRLALVSLTVGTKPFLLETSSLFIKAGSRDDPNAPAVQKEIVLGPERRLSFRLEQAVDLQ